MASTQKTTLLPPNGRSHALEFMEEHDRLQSALVVAQDELKNTLLDNKNLMAEVAMLRDQLNRVETERTRLQAYAVDLTTRLTVIKEVIDTSVAESRKFAAKPVVPEPPPSEPAEPDLVQLAELVERLPKNGLS